MKTPPFLVGATLIFWGWQTGFFIVGAAMALVLEGARFFKARWELSEEDFSRIWTFCSLLFLATGAYGFAASNGPANVGGLFTPGSFSPQNNVGTTATKTAVLMIRWVPMCFFLFVAAQAYCNREGIPLEAISLILRRRRRQAKLAGRSLPPSPEVDIAYPYFIASLFAASGHPATEKNEFFGGLCVLAAWGLWSQRSRRFSWRAWGMAMAVALSLAFAGQHGLVRLKQAFDQYTPPWLSLMAHPKFDPSGSRTEIGQLGRIKTSGFIVIHLETTNGIAPPYLREAAYQTYRSGVWHVAASSNDFSPVPEVPLYSEQWPLVTGKSRPNLVNIACYLPGGRSVLPLPPGSSLLDQLPAYVLQKNSVGAVRADGPGLVIFNAHYGLGAQIDSPPDTNQDLEVAEMEKPALDEIIAGLHLEGASRDDKLEAVSRFFGNGFTYSLWQEPSAQKSTNNTAIGRFLLNTRSGHCEYFATATVLLLRELGIPARYTVGYAVHEQSGNKFVVRQSDAHAWCRVWNDRTKIWDDLDTTPGVWFETERHQRSAFQFISDGWSRLLFEFSKFRWGQSHLRQYIFWFLIPVLALLLYQIIFRSNRRRAGEKLKNARDAASWPGLDSEFYQLEQKLAQRGLPRPTHEPLSEWLRRTASDPHFSEFETSLRSIVRLHYRHRFDPQGLAEDDRESLRREVSLCLSKLGETK